MSDTPKKKQGFACLTPERRREIAALGGRSVPPEKRAYSVDNDLARRAGLKGGVAPHVSRGGCPTKETIEIWKGAKIARIRRLALAGKSLVEVRDEIESNMKIPAFREKCRRYGIVFDRTRPL